jgi:hypothetical protein
VPVLQCILPKELCISSEIVMEADGSFHITHLSCTSFCATLHDDLEPSVSD